jgi:hypothetical protein
MKCVETYNATTVRFQEGAEHSSLASRPEWLLGQLSFLSNEFRGPHSIWVMRPKHDADYWPPSTAKISCEWCYTSSAQTPSDTFWYSGRQHNKYFKINESNFYTGFI